MPRHQAVWIALSLAILGVVPDQARAFVPLSLRSEATFEFFEDEFDHLQDPAKLAGQQGANAQGHRLVEGFDGYHLFTNLANQADVDTFQLGGILPAGKGMLGILLDYRRDDYARLEGGDSGRTTTDDGVNRQDRREWAEETMREVSAEKARDLYLGYGLALPGTPFSLGAALGYADADGWQETSSGSMRREEWVDPCSRIGSSHQWESTDEERRESSRLSRMAKLEVRYNRAPVDGVVDLRWERFRGSRDFRMESIRDTVLREGDDRGSRRQEQLQVRGGYYAPGPPILGAADRHGQGNRWSLGTESILELNGILALGIELSYTRGEADDNLLLWRRNQEDFQGQEDAWHTSTEQSLSESRASLGGGAEENAFATRAELRVTLPRVLLGFGLAYLRSTMEGSYAGPVDYTLRQSRDDGDHVPDREEWVTVFCGSRGEATVAVDGKEEILRLPVAVEFSVTERLKGRLGAEYRRATTRTSLTERVAVEGVSTTTFGDGSVRIGPQEFHSGTRTAADRTLDQTTFKAGVGYRVTEHLRLDAVWSARSGWVVTGSGEDSEREEISLSEVSLGATLSF
jgi:hypothetical protein